MIMLLLVAALGAASSLPRHNYLTASTGASLFNTSGMRLIKTDPQAPPKWMNESEVSELVRRSECGGGPHHPKPGFIDVTRVSKDRQFRNSSAILEHHSGRPVVFPARPSKQSEVRTMIDDHLVPGGEIRGLEFLEPLTAFNNRYFTGPEVRAAYA
jgi:hypothetical protein